MKQYLVEQVWDKHLGVVALKMSWHAAHAMMVGKQGIITEMEVDVEYPEGIGACNHWHYDADGPEQNGPEEVAETIFCDCFLGW